MLLVCVVCILINMGGVRLMELLGWPLFLDSVGTVIAATMSGYLPGIIVGLFTNLMKGISDTEALYYVVVNALIALIAYWFVNKGLLKKIYGWAGLVLAMAVLGWLYWIVISLVMKDPLTTEGIWEDMMIELADKRLHIVGFGKIGRRVAAIASALGMNVSSTPHNLNSSEEKVEGYTVKMLPLEEGLASADVVTLHCPLTPETNALINEERISAMKDGAILLNCSRGPVIDEAAVRKALDSGKLSGFGADVVSVEPMLPDNPLLGAPNTFITPHIAWAPVETRKRLIQAAADNIGAYIKGERLNRVD